MTFLEEVSHCGGWIRGLIYAQVMFNNSDHFVLPVGHTVNTLSSFSRAMSVCLLPYFLP